MKLFPAHLALVTKALRLAALFRLSLREKEYAKTKPWMRHC